MLSKVIIVGEESCSGQIVLFYLLHIDRILTSSAFHIQIEKYAEGKWTEVQASDRFKLTKTDAQVSHPTLNLAHFARSILNFIYIYMEWMLTPKGLLNMSI
jgi:hypothetical protein